MQYVVKTFKVTLEVSESGAKANGPADLVQIARAIYADLDADKEHFTVLALNSKNRVNGFKVISTGSLTASLVHPREVYRAALALAPVAVVFIHNHPGGNPAPSPEDIEITKQLKLAGELLKIKVLDHIIICPDLPLHDLGGITYYSFSDRGLL